ncbi:MAG: hypothetical protein JRH06_06965 [Deltaproteobacteria bacterium]|nr:hypothetical protein [Deltaproteobacteria bacterium]MBW2137282.1 hypothetical protein [Deltaproteobacteria bacterium]
MKCEYCGRTIKGKPARKTMKGTDHIFCTEMCFRLEYYQVPKFDLNSVYEKKTISIECPDFRELIEEQE